MLFVNELGKQGALHHTITAAYRMDEAEHVKTLLASLNFSSAENQSITDTAKALVEKVRKSRVGKGGLDAFMYQYDLSSEEGIALMCLAEALLRVPDKETIDKLIHDKITSADWQKNIGRDNSLFVNAATWGLMLTGKILSGRETAQEKWQNALSGVVGRLGEPVIRKAVFEAIKILGKQFVCGRTIEEALERSKEPTKLGYSYSYDMLGEAAHTAADAQRYFEAYQNAILAISKTVTPDMKPTMVPGISIKLSALHPRYEFAKQDIAIPELTEKLKTLALQAKYANIGLTVDAEEANRLDISLKIIEAVFTDPELAEWEGFGLALQAYQKRAFYVIDYLIEMARKTKKRLMVRLVKGAYWDSEIKDSQVNGYNGYPVFTRKASTDVSYIAIAKKMAEAHDAIYPAFATHNAHTVSVILALMKDREDYEFQCLKGMGRALYDQIVGEKNMNLPCRMYAPVGQHEDLLPYLVRRLLENGANTSFVNRIVDEKAPIDDIIKSPIETVSQYTTIAHPKIALPKDIYGKSRINSAGIDFTNLAEVTELDRAMEHAAGLSWTAEPMIANSTANKGDTHAVTNPANHDETVGTTRHATDDQVELALENARNSFDKWTRMPVELRADMLNRVADLFEQHRAELMYLAVKEAGKVLPDAIAEVREAVDFCRYYAEQALKHLAPQVMPGPTGEHNELQLHGRGPILCISPWNFPLAIFTGQITAALAAGNTVLAKPAEQTPLIAARAVALMHEAGIPSDVLQLVPGKGSVVGAKMVSDLRVKGVVFTGSTETANLINKTLATRGGAIVPLIAETGGQNAMIADSTALPEQLVMDIVSSAFHSAGQRCSACRVLFVQDVIADKVLTMLKGAMDELHVSNPQYLSTDIGPAIDKAALDMLTKHAKKLDKIGSLIYRVPMDPQETSKGTFFAPCAYEINQLSDLEREVFGPVLHVIRFSAKELDKVIDDINNTGYGLTLGIHTRIEDVAQYIQARVRAGNAYVNRNMIGAVVGVQPFGGEGLSGTGPKAGGPHYLLRMCNERTLTVNTTATGGNASLLALED